MQDKLGASEEMKAELECICHKSECGHDPECPRCLADIAASRTPSANREVVEAVARQLHFDFVDQHGYPNGLPIWDEMPEQSQRRIAADLDARETWRSLAQAALSAMGVGDATSTTA